MRRTLRDRPMMCPALALLAVTGAACVTVRERAADKRPAAPEERAAGMAAGQAPVRRRAAPPPSARRRAASRRGVGLSKAERGVVLAMVNGLTITQGEFCDRIHQKSVFLRRRYKSLARRREFLEKELILPLLEYQAARKKGLERDPSVARTRKNMIVSRLMRRLRDELTVATPTDRTSG